MEQAQDAVVVDRRDIGKARDDLCVEGLGARMGGKQAQLARQRLPLGGICTGSYLLAKAELLKGYRCTIHWEDLPTLQAHFPGIVISSQLFELDRDRYTCSGGVAAMDMMLQLVARDTGGQDIAAKAAELLLCDRVRGERERQRVPLRTLLGSAQPKLSQVVAIMEANLEEPLGLEELASLNDVTVRQLSVAAGWGVPATRRFTF